MPTLRLTRKRISFPFSEIAKSVPLDSITSLKLLLWGETETFHQNPEVLGHSSVHSSKNHYCSGVEFYTRQILPLMGSEGVVIVSRKGTRATAGVNIMDNTGHGEPNSGQFKLTRFPVIVESSSRLDRRETIHRRCAFAISKTNLSLGKGF